MMGARHTPVSRRAAGPVYPNQADRRFVSLRYTEPAAA